MKKYIIAILFGVSHITYANEHRIEPTNVTIDPATPASAQFTRYDRMPISEYTGIPNISVPLYEIDVDEVKLPLNLSYHAGGIRVDQIASWVGLGWDLSLPNIIQIINGEDDIIPYGYSSSWDEIKRILPDYQSSYSYNYEAFPWNGGDNQYSGPPNINTLPVYTPELKYGYRVAMKSYIPIKGAYRQNMALYNGDRIDSEPDAFIVNLLGERIHFILKFNDSYIGGKQVVVLNKKGYKIDFITNDTGWVLTNPSGTKFYFSSKVETICNSITSSTRGMGMSVDNRSKTIWLLNKIITKNQKVIEIEYGNNSNLEQTFVSHYGEYRITPPQNSLLSILSSDKSVTDILTYYKPADSVKTTTNVTEGQYYLKNITFPLGKINFHTSSGRRDIGLRKLDSLTIHTSPILNTIKEVIFNYDYFEDKGTHSCRMKLLSVTIDSNQKYDFKYNGTQLPAKNSFAVDYWGYYNGAHFNSSYIINPSRFQDPLSKHINNGNNKSANLYYTKACILEEIIYPTGGKVRFDYELNEFSNFYFANLPNYNLNDNKATKGYGLRIQNITHIDNDEIKKITSYEYKSGKPAIPLRMIRNFNYKWTEFFKDNDWVRCINERVSLLSTDVLLSVTPFASHSTIGYDTVICINKTKNGNTIGKTISVFHNNKHITNYTDIQGGYYSVNLPSIKDPSLPENGSLKKVLQYNDKGTLLQEKEYKYKNISSAIHYGVKISRLNSIIEFTGLSEAPSFWFFSGTRHLLAYYPIFDFETLLEKETNIDYFDSNSVKVEKEYTYNNYHQVSSILTSTSDVNKKIKQDFTYLNMINRYADVKSIDEYLITNNSPSLISTKDMEYLPQPVKPNGTNAYVYFPWKYTEKKGSFNSSDEVRETLYERYDPYYGNLLQKKGSDGKYISYIWSYKGTYPVAIVENATYEEIENVMPSEVLNTLIQASNPGALLLEVEKIRTLLPNAHITTYKYKPLVGMIESTDPRGVTTYYEYDNSGRLKDISVNESGEKKKVQEYNYIYMNK